MYNFVKLILVLVFCFIYYLIHVIKGSEERIKKQNEEKLKNNKFDVRIDEDED